MLSPTQEIHSVYLRTLRQALMDVLLPEITDIAAANALDLCDGVLVRMIGSLENPPASRLPNNLSALQARMRDLFVQLDDAPRRPGAPALGQLAEIAAADALRCEIRESVIQSIAAQREPALRSLRIARPTIQAWFDKRFPDSPVQVRECRQLAGGRSKLTVFVGLEENGRWPSGLVLRIDNPGSAQNTSVLDEYPVLRAMHAVGVAAPEALWLESGPSWLGAPFLVMRRMDGTPPGNLWSAEGVSQAIARGLAETLVSLQRQDARSIWPSAPASAREAVEEMMRDLRKRRCGRRDVTSLPITCAFGWLESHMDWIDGPPVPVHGDAHFANVLAEGDRLVCLTDWEFCHAGHPAEDLAFCRSSVEQIMSWGDFIAHYRACGGAEITDDQLSFFGVWGYLRNAVFAVDMLERLATGAPHDVQSLSIALHSRARVEAQLSQALARAMKSDSTLRLSDQMRRAMS